MPDAKTSLDPKLYYASDIDLTSSKATDLTVCEEVVGNMFLSGCYNIYPSPRRVQYDYRFIS